MTTRAHKTISGATNIGAAGRPSTKLDERNIPNPYYNKVFQLADCPEYEFVMGLVGDKSEEEELADLLTNPEVMEALYLMLDRFDEVPMVPPTMPPAPQSQILYSRTTDDAYVADIGSGDGKKAAKSQSKITFYDREPASPNVQVLDVDRSDLPDVDVITSYNTLTQLRDPTKLLEADSLHIFPSVSYVKTRMGSEEHQGYLITKIGDKVFKDRNDHIVGDEVSEGYLCMTGYKRSELDLELTRKPAMSAPFDIPIRDTKTELAGPATKKYDGVALKLSFQRGLATLTTRKGKGMVLDFYSEDVYCPKCRSHYRGKLCTNYRCRSSKGIKLMESRLPKDFILYIERVKCGIETYYVLLRVVLYGRMVPFHGLENLKSFCKKIRITIDGIRLLAPGDMALATLPFDGYIYRHGFCDYRLKTVYTIELRSTDRFQQAANEKGYVVEVDGHMSDGNGLAEYYLTTSKGIYFLRFHRMRYDKDHETDYRDIHYVMDMATLVDGAERQSVFSYDTSLDTLTEG